MSVNTWLAILLGKAIHNFTRILNIGGGSAAPGYYGLKIDPDLVANLASKIPKTVIITGTNGKTTTARMLAQFAKEHGLKVIRNATGSNLERGIASSLIQHSPLFAHHSADLAIWELDEAAFNIVAPQLKPDMIVFLNAFRDQLDRYGEVDSVVEKWCRTLSELNPQTQVFINGDDQNLIRLKEHFKGKVQTFGLETNKIAGEKVTKQRKAQKLDFKAEDIQPRGLDSISFVLTMNHEPLTINLPVPGIYHVYNFLAAYILAKELNIPDQKIKESLKKFLPAFGRVERFTLPPPRWQASIQDITGYIFLIKNPTGATQVLQTLAPEIKPQDRLLLALNDNLADGTDVSWIWDTNFELLQTMNHEQRTICSGSRAEEIALRLKYASIDQDQITIENNLEKAFEEARTGLKSLPAGRQGRLFVLPTYTALLNLQKILTSKGLKKHYWKESA